MPDEIGRITARISEIQDRIASLGGQTPWEPPPAAPEAAPAAPTFAQALSTAQAHGPAGDTRLPDAPAGVSAPPASLGPLPTLPGAAGVAPLPVAAPVGLDGLVQKYAARHGLAPSLVHAVIQTESGGNPRAVSRAGAMGLMQLMPGNVKEAGIADPFDPEQNIAAGTQQLADLMKQYGGDLDLALAGYNAGPGSVRRYGGVPPFHETQDYIRRVRAAMGGG